MPPVRLALVVVFCLLFQGCAENPPAPIETRSAAATTREATSPQSVHSSPDYGPTLTPGAPYTVRKGDTLYAIAFRLGVDFRTLAQRNGIPAPYTIYPGDVLKTGRVNATATADKAPQTQGKISAPKPTKKVAATPASTAKTVDKSLSNADPPAPKTTANRSPPSKVPKPVTKPSSTRRDTQNVALGPVSRWLWPGTGGVERPYSDVLHKGIDIAGRRGDPVFATAPGVVVYAGTGVKGYGALLIVKHNDQFLSAYGHNDAMLVAEGTRVAAGQQIARMGSSGTDTVKLHFEIRRQGKPVDPLRLLPRR